MATLDRAIEQGKPRSRLMFARRQAGLLFVLPSVLFMAVFFVEKVSNDIPFSFSS